MSEEKVVTGSGEEPGIVEKEGILIRKGQKLGKWKSRYFQLKDNNLVYFKHAGDKKRKGVIPLESCSVEFVAESKHDKKFCFEITSPVTKLVYVLVADSGTEMQTWINFIRRAMLKLRREKSKRQRESLSKSARSSLAYEFGGTPPRTSSGSVSYSSPSTFDSPETRASRGSIYDSPTSNIAMASSSPAQNPFDSTPDPVADRRHAQSVDPSSFRSAMLGTPPADSPAQSSQAYEPYRSMDDPSSPSPYATGSGPEDLRVPLQTDDKYGVYRDWLEADDETPGGSLLGPAPKRRRPCPCCLVM